MTITCARLIIFRIAFYLFLLLYSSSSITFFKLVSIEILLALGRFLVSTQVLNCRPVLSFESWKNSHGFWTHEMWLNLHVNYYVLICFLHKIYCFNNFLRIKRCDYFYNIKHGKVSQAHHFPARAIWFQSRNFTTIYSNTSNGTVILQFPIVVVFTAFVSGKEIYCIYKYPQENWRLFYNWCQSKRWYS